MLAKSETVSAVLRVKPDIADQRAESSAVARGLTMLFQIISFLRPVGYGHRDALADRSCGLRQKDCRICRAMLRTPEATIRGLLMSELQKRVDVRRLTVLQINLPLRVGRAG
jgi:hypothetical protein